MPARSSTSSAAIVAVFLIARAPAVDAIELVYDINSTYTSRSSMPRDIVDLGSRILFTSEGAVHGRELWTSDGTAAGTRLVRDINPGLASSNPESLTVINGVAYFWADDGTNGRELWRSDGTAAGTSIVANIGPGATDSGGFYTPGKPMPRLNGIMYFQADDGATGKELWRSDGTTNGTYRLLDISPGEAGSSPEQFVQVGQRLFFSATTAAHGRELWSSDGTTAGTRLVRDIQPGAGYGVGELSQSAVTGTAIFFRADDGVHGTELWCAPTDGSAARMVVDLNSTPDPWSPGRTEASEQSAILTAGDAAIFVGTARDSRGASTHLYRADCSGAAPTALLSLPQFRPIYPVLRVGEKLVFVFSGPTYSTDLWVTDGTAAGTMPLRPSGEALFASSVLDIVEGEGESFFFGYTGSSGSPINLWRTDGTVAGTRVYATLPQGFFGSELVRIGARFYLKAGGASDPAGNELWTTDGTTDGTYRVADIYPGPVGSRISGLRVAMDRLFFSADDGANWGFWTSDGSAAGTLRIGEPAGVEPASSDPNTFLRFRDGVLFAADDGVVGPELWFSDGTAAGTRLVKDIQPPGASFPPIWLTPVEDFVLFLADDGVTGRELWRTDGTEAGTYLVADIAPGPQHGDPLNHGFGGVVLNGVMYFAADDGVHGPQLWRSDGTGAGTWMVIELAPRTVGGQVMPLGVAGQRVLFRYKNRLWATDGSAAGTVELSSDVTVTGAWSDVAQLGDALYFPGRDESGAVALWRSDGTAAGTVPLVNSAFTPSAIESIRATDTAVVFTAWTYGAGRQIYGSDGTASSIAPLGPYHNPIYTRAGSRLFFHAKLDGKTSLFETDGTAEGTREFVAGVPQDAKIYQFCGLLDGLLFFTVSEPTLGYAIWVSDGTTGGTRRYAHLGDGGNGDRFPHGYAAIGSKLLLSAYYSETGRELYAIRSGQPLANPDGVRTPANTHVRIDVLANDSPFQGSLDKSTVVIDVQPGHGAVVVDASTGEIVYTPAADFSGADAFGYRVSDTYGRQSNTAIVTIIVAAPIGGSPGPSPQPPSSGGSGRGKGGGGSSSLVFLLLLMSLISIRRAPAWRASSPTGPLGENRGIDSPRRSRAN